MLVVSRVALVIVLLLPERAVRMYSHSGADKIQVQKQVIHTVFKSVGHCFIKFCEVAIETPAPTQRIVGVPYAIQVLINAFGVTLVTYAAHRRLVLLYGVTYNAHRWFLEFGLQASDSFPKGFGCKGEEGGRLRGHPRSLRPGCWDDQGRIIPMQPCKLC